MLFAFFSWWYGQGWRQVASNFGPRIGRTADSFSVNQLLRTLFAPWRRIISDPGRALDDKIRAWADNLFSRIIGFIVRLGVLVAAALVVTFVALLTIVEIIAWPLIPLLVPVLIILGVIA